MKKWNLRLQKYTAYGMTLEMTLEIETGEMTLKTRNWDWRNDTCNLDDTRNDIRNADRRNDTRNSKLRLKKWHSKCISSVVSSVSICNLRHSFPRFFWPFCWKRASFAVSSQNPIDSGLFPCDIQPWLFPCDIQPWLFPCDINPWLWINEIETRDCRSTAYCISNFRIPLIQPSSHVTLNPDSESMGLRLETAEVQPIAFRISESHWFSPLPMWY